MFLFLVLINLLKCIGKCSGQEFILVSKVRRAWCNACFFLVDTDLVGSLSCLGVQYT